MEYVKFMDNTLSFADGMGLGIIAQSIKGGNRKDINRVYNLLSEDAQSVANCMINPKGKNNNEMDKLSAKLILDWAGKQKNENIS